MNESAVVPFYFQENEVRTITINNEPWFVAKDICDILALESVTKALLRVPETHKGVNSIQTLGGIQQMNTVDESGLYRLILRSDKPEAEPFMEWVTAEVLPSIRRTGSYGLAVGGDMVPVNRQYFESLQENNSLLSENSRLLKQLLNNELNRKPQRRNFTPEEDAMVADLRAQGMSYRKIGLEVDRVPESIKSCLRRLKQAEEVQA